MSSILLPRSRRDIRQQHRCHRQRNGWNGEVKDWCESDRVVWNDENVAGRTKWGPDLVVVYK